jgi:uncharacterized protein with FMN-binding domain
MRKAIAALVVTVVVVVLLLNFKTRPAALSGARVAPPASGTAVASARQRASSHVASGGGAGGTRAATGDLIQHQYGDVQVAVRVRNGAVTAVRTVRIDGNGGHSQEIDRQVEPMLRAEALQAGSARIDTISGATYTSEAYIASLQSAIDRARGA